MKKLIALAMALVMVFAMAACGNNSGSNADVNTKSEGVMTWAEYDAAALDTEVVVECYVQGHQSWWDNKITVYAQDPDGGYFMYEMACSEEDAAKLVPGTKIRVTGFKGEWQGEIEIMDATFEILEGSWIADATDVTALLGTEELIKHQNKKVVFKGMTIDAIEYKNGEPGDDIYVTVSKDGVSYSFCVERYLTDPESDLYKMFVNEELQVGDVVNVYGFVYWYDADEDGESGDGINTHITAIQLIPADA